MSLKNIHKKNYLKQNNVSDLCEIVKTEGTVKSIDNFDTTTLTVSVPAYMVQGVHKWKSVWAHNNITNTQCASKSTLMRFGFSNDLFSGDRNRSTSHVSTTKRTTTPTHHYMLYCCCVDDGTLRCAAAAQSLRISVVFYDKIIIKT